MYYVGYSQGNTQILYGISHQEDFFASHLHRFVALSPCFLINVDEDEEKARQKLDANLQLADYGVYAVNGPNQEEDLETICDNFDESICQYYTDNSVEQTNSVKSELLWDMNTISGRFQESISREEWENGIEETDLIPLSNIKEVPITFFVAEDENMCHGNEEYVPMIQSEKTWIEIPDVNHFYFEIAASNDWFMNQLEQQLQVTQ